MLANGVDIRHLAGYLGHSDQLVPCHIQASWQGLAVLTAPRLATTRPALAGTKGAGMGELDFVHDFEQARRLHGALWAAGDYTRVAEQLTEVSAVVVNA